MTVILKKPKSDDDGMICNTCKNKEICVRDWESPDEGKLYEACEGYTPSESNPTDVPNSPDTGSVVPYVAIGGGLVAIAAVYLYSRKSNKVYKI